MSALDEMLDMADPCPPETRARALAELVALRADVERLRDAEERIRNYLQAIGLPEHKTSKIAKWLLTGESRP
jgi:hypothetical protein